MKKILSTIGKPLTVGMDIEHLNGQYIGSWCDGSTIFIHPLHTNSRKEAEERLIDFVIEQLKRAIPNNKVGWWDWESMTESEIHKLMSDARFELERREAYRAAEAQMGKFA